LSGVDLAPHKTIRIAVSGDVTLNRIETRIVDTRDFQRLRAIKQLGTSCLVYPTAVHTRFDHSLGTSAMAARMIQAIRENTRIPSNEREISREQEQLARLYALLHDITHVPFGHEIEDGFCIFPRHDESRARIERFLGADSPVGKILLDGLGAELHGRLLALFRAAAGERRALEAMDEDMFILDLVTNTICADLLDYLRRDAHFCNVSLDSDYRFLRHLAVTRHEGRRRLVVQLWKEGKSTPRRDVLNELIRLLDNRYLMGERVYFHHAKLVAGAMVAGAVVRAARAGEIREEDLYEIGDDVLLWKLGRSKEPAVRKLADRLASRQLWKLVYERGRGLITAEQQIARDLDILDDLARRWHADAPGRAAAEDRIAELLGLEAGDFLLHCPHPRMSRKLAEILVFWNGALRPLKDCSDDPLVGTKLQSILDSHRNLWAIRAFLDPTHGHLADVVVSACESLFTYVPVQKRRHAEFFYRSVFDRFAREEGRAEGLALERYEQGMREALERMLALAEERRDAEAALRIVEQIFARAAR